MQRLIKAKAMIAIFCILEFIKVCNNRNSIVFDLLRLVLRIYNHFLRRKKYKVPNEESIMMAMEKAKPYFHLKASMNSKFMP